MSPLVYTVRITRWLGVRLLLRAWPSVAREAGVSPWNLRALVALAGAVVSIVFMRGRS